MLKKIKKKLKNVADVIPNNRIAHPKLPEGYLGCADEIIKPCVTGWVSSTQSAANPVALKITKGDEVKLVFADETRNDVLNSGLVKTAFCGYSVTFSESNFEQAKVEILLPAGTLNKVATSYKGRKIFFIHIPKAAGSSVNDCVCSAIDGAYYTHIEGLRDRWDDIKEAKFLSGHIRYYEYEKDFSKSDYIVFAFFREPFAHVKSHMNWVKRLSEPELIEKRESHPDIVKNISDDLASFEFTDIKALKLYVKNIKPVAYGLFDNCQVRFLSDVNSNERVTQRHLDQAIKNLQHLHYIGISEYSKESQNQLMSLVGLNRGKPEAKVNINFYDYGLNLNETEVIDALEPLVKYDLKLYEIAKSRFLMSSNSGTFR